ncbi:tight adherence protein B [Sinomonas atrocyanea]|uniref:type II secretion system F family protein n=1 Tax=Sinomonas atrocyanea TaxID=37927 RepID=UPI00278B44E9|nr:type II secretion system F family protein [Sinomonas atrocyanea]MDP9884828.1 tight adherence protein B [Sinomonas atrocyanea]
MQTPVVLIAGLLCIYGALGAGVFFVLKSHRGVPLERRRQGVQTSVSTLTKVTDSAVGALNQTLGGRRLRLMSADKFEQAGLKIRAADFLLMCGAGLLAGGILGFLLGGLGLGFLLVIAAPAGLFLWVNLKASRRQAKFAEQLPDALQGIAGSLRAGHSLLHAIDGGADDAESPMREELQRVINETRIGRDLIDSLLDTAARMKSEDFLWAAQAIETQREVGGNLAEVLENVNETIRERAQLGRMVKSLSAEGRTSAIVLVALPIVMLALLCLMNPFYASTFFASVLGWIMLGAAALLLGVGTFWLSRLIKPKY